MKFVSKSVEDTQKIAASLALSLKPPSTVAFFGGLGAGKTTFIKALCAALGYDGPVTSPTFAIMNMYNASCPIHHFDMYRIKGGDALYDIGFYDLEQNSITLIEWSENIREYLPENCINVTISCKEQVRIITID